MSVLRCAPLVAGVAALTIAASACGVKNGEPVAGGLSDARPLVREFGRIKERMDRVDSEVHATEPARPITRASARRWAAEVKKELGRYRPLKTDALALHDDAQEVDDVDLRRATELLVDVIELRRREIASFVRAAEGRPFRPQLLALLSLTSEEVKRTDEAWSRLAERLSERYATGERYATV